MMKKQFDVVGLGVNTLDLTAVINGFPQPDTKQQMHEFSVQGGGMIATAMVACSRLGLKTRYVGKIGSDFWSRLSMRTLAKEGIDTKAIIRHPKSVGQISIVLADRFTGQRTLFSRRPKEYTIEPTELNKLAIISGRLLHIDGVDVAAALQAINWAREAGMIITMDGERMMPGIEDVCKNVDQFIANPLFLAKLTKTENQREALKCLATQGPKRVAVTLAEKGVLGYTQGQFIEIAGFPVDAVDTNGAGDVFHGACAIGELKNWPFEWTLTFASAVAAIKCRSLGGRQGIPTLDQTRLFLAERGYNNLAEAC